MDSGFIAALDSAVTEFAFRGYFGVGSKNLPV
jgi:hypothetical protein